MSLPEHLWKRAVLKKGQRISEAIAALNDTALQIVLVVDGNMKLVGTITDGDIRRQLLKGLDIGKSVSEIMCLQMLTVDEETSFDEALSIMRRTHIGQLPVIDHLGHLVGLHVWGEELSSPPELSNLFFIMAGGIGKRLRPYTEHCPKPLLRVAGKPILERIIEKARGEGFFKFVISIGYLGSMIEEYFEDGSKFSVQIEYLRETKPLGTVGALTLLGEMPSSSFVMTNGDVLCDLKYSDLLKHHQNCGADITMAVRKHRWQHPFGVVEIDNERVTSVTEKPILDTYVNAGIYALDERVLKRLKTNERCDMTCLIDELIEHNLDVAAYPLHEPWTDIGVPLDLEKAREQFEG